MTTDPIGDFLVRLQNASRVHHDRASVPFSKMKAAVAEVLKREGYIASVKEKGESPPERAGSVRTGAKKLEVELKYRDDGRPVISGSKRISKPSRRMYMGIRDIRPVKRGYGLVVLSTPNGILSGKEAREKKVGGEILFEIW